MHLGFLTLRGGSRMPTKLKYGIFLGVLVHPTMHARLVTVAEAEGLTWSDVVRAGLDRVLPPCPTNALPKASQSEPHTGGKGPETPPTA
jgi:hypothetical protein